ILGLDDKVVEDVCESIDGVVVAANYNCPGQLVISGSVAAIDEACEKLTAAGARRAMKLAVGGAFHSSLMESAREELAAVIEATEFKTGVCPVYQNVSAQAETDPQTIKANLITQLTSPVRWTQTMQSMIADGAGEVIEVGPGKVLQGLFKKIDRQFPTSSATV
ncbi:MAG: ACP S-malonyltransferase, partial [Bacteroidetes bacterium]|nr:ACP S-malonyltransferase [Bacteroidota bacterium]